MNLKLLVKTTLALAAVTTAACSETVAPKMVATPTCEAERVTVATPPNRARVPYRPLVSGRVYPACSAVWLVIRGPNQDLYWVQPKPVVAGSGEWTAQVYVGTPTQQYGAVQGGGTFELIALANPTEPLRSGEALYGLPDAQARSRVVLLERGGAPPEPR